MIDDEEGMDNALDYYTNGEADSYWKRFVNNIDDRLERWAEEKTMDEMNNTNTNEVSNVDSDEEYEEEQDYCDWDEYDDYDVEWDEGDYDDE